MNNDRKVEQEIDSLLGREDTESVIDSVLAMPRGAIENDSTWDKALHARLQDRLARKLRRALEEGTSSRSAA